MTVPTREKIKEILIAINKEPGDNDVPIYCVECLAFLCYLDKDKIDSDLLKEEKGVTLCNNYCIKDKMNVLGVAELLDKGLRTTNSIEDTDEPEVLLN